jgi:membrane fusion protein, epimerase transport system
MPNVKLIPACRERDDPDHQRTAFDYLVGPLVMSLNHSFRQK